MSKNTNKNTGGVTGKGFDVLGQPSPEAKSKGWERRREARKILDEFMRQTDMTYKEIKELLDDVKAHPENHTLREVKIANYLMSQKYTIDWLDRHIGKAPQEMDIKGDVNLTVVDVVKKLKELDDEPIN
jgi:DNA-binding transcriptional MerR regulator